MAFLFLVMENTMWKLKREMGDFPPLCADVMAREEIHSFSLEFIIQDGVRDS